MVADILILAAVSCLNLAGGNLLTGAAGIASAALIVFLLRLNRRMAQVCRALIGQNARLIRRNAELCPEGAGDGELAATEGTGSG